jgi:hypothetical protein
MGKCHDCVHWRAGGVGGECRKNAPPWPVTGALDGCGDFAARSYTGQAAPPPGKPPQPDPHWLDAKHFMGHNVATQKGVAPMPSNAVWVDPRSTDIVANDGQRYRFNGKQWEVCVKAVLVTSTSSGGRFVWTSTERVLTDDEAAAIETSIGKAHPNKTPAADPFLNRGIDQAEALHRAMTKQEPVDTDPDAMRRRIERATRDLSGG